MNRNNPAVPADETTPDEERDPDEGPASNEDPESDEGPAPDDAPPDPVCSPGLLEVDLGPETEDAYIRSLPSEADMARPDDERFTATAWTNSGTPHVDRCLIQFALPELPSGGIVEEVTLTLFPTVHKDTFRTGGGHTSLTSSNASVFRPVLDLWSEQTVTWNNQPATTAVDSVALPESESFDQVYELDVTSWATKVYAGDSENHGFMLQLQDEKQYASLHFNSTDVDPEEGTIPRLVVRYTCE